jgi:hypothetical protein
VLTLILSFLGNNWKPVAIIALILGIGGYVKWLKYDVDRQKAKVAEQQALVRALDNDIGVLKADLENAKYAIGEIDKGVRQYQLYVQKALASVKASQNRISGENARLGMLLDNLVGPATAAGRIEDAPKIPFFTDNVSVAVPCILIGVRDGVYHFRVSSGPRPGAVDRGAGLPRRDPCGAAEAAEAGGFSPI